MTRNSSCIECTFLVITIFAVFSIFISILIEERLYHYEKDFNYGPYNIEQRPSTPKAETHIPVISRVKLPNHNQEDPELVKDLASKILPPCPHTVDYFSNKPVRGGIGKFKHIRKLTNNSGKRFFLECGVGDGESLSNTLFLEKTFFWKGLLVEADPAHFTKLISLHRRAWIAPACMSLNTSAYVAHFKSSPSFEGKVLTTNESSGEDVVKVVCYPFYTFILALSIERIDYLSLSVSGHEMEILETIPFHRVDIAFISVDVSKARGGPEGVKRFMHRHGYDQIAEYPPSELIFVNIDEDYW